MTPSHSPGLRPHHAAVGVNSASLEAACDPLVPITVFVLRNAFHDLADTSAQAWGPGKCYLVAGNSFERTATAIEIDEAEDSSVITEGDEGLDQGFAAFLGTYGLDISEP